MLCFATTTAARQVLRLPAATAHAGEAYGLLRQSTGPQAVIVLDEDDHRRLRKLILSPLHGRRLKPWEAFAEQRTREDIESWPVGEPFSLRPVTERITMAVISKIVFGTRDPARGEELRGLLPTLIDLTLPVSLGYVTPFARIDLGPRSPWGRFRRRRDSLDALIHAEIRERRREFETAKPGESTLEARSDLLSMLLEARDEQGRAMTDDELRDQLVTMLVAGPTRRRRRSPGRWSGCCARPWCCSVCSRRRTRATPPTSTRSSRRRCASGPSWRSSGAW